MNQGTPQSVGQGLLLLAVTCWGAQALAQSAAPPSVVLQPSQDSRLQQILKEDYRASRAPAAPAAPANSSEATPHSMVDKAFAQCLQHGAESGRYSSLDGGKSARALLEKVCPSEYLQWADACAKAGDSDKSCITKAAIAAQVALKLFAE